ncbi:MAG: PAS domain S-box protein [Bacteroidetes bacterium]|nr:PAS domain S-box protein [Bacteroidota bacterium]
MDTVTRSLKPRTNPPVIPGGGTGVKDKRIDQIYDIIMQLASGNVKVKPNLSEKSDKLGGIIKGLSLLRKEIIDMQLERIGAKQEISEILKVVESFASLNYSKKAKLRADTDLFNTLAKGINKLGEELQSSTVSRDYFENVLQSMINMLIVVNPDGTIRTVNSAALELLGYQENELIGKSISIIFSQDISPSKKGRGKVIEELIKKGTVHNVEKVFISKSGNKIPVLFSGSLMSDDNCKLQAIVCAAQDITRRKQVEEERKKRAEATAAVKAGKKRAEELERINAELKKADEHIKASLKEKEILLKEIHHRVKNNMQVISGLLDLQADKSKDPAIKAFSTKAKDRIRSMALLHEKIYLSKDLANIEISGYIETLTDELVYNYNIDNNIKLKREIDEVFLDIDRAIPLGLIINELVSNSLKYAFPKGRKGEIFISLKSKKNNKIVLEVGDNGLGLPKNFDIQNTETLGLELVRSLTQQLKGSLEIIRHNGTKFKIEFAE